MLYGSCTLNIYIDDARIASIHTRFSFLVVKPDRGTEHSTVDYRALCAAVSALAIKIPQLRLRKKDLEKLLVLWAYTWPYTVYIRPNTVPYVAVATSGLF